MVLSGIEANQRLTHNEKMSDRAQLEFVESSKVGTK